MFAQRSYTRVSRSQSARHRVKSRNAWFFPPKLTIHALGDEYEQGADALTEHAVQAPPVQAPVSGTVASGAVQRQTVEPEEEPVQRKCSECEKEEKEQVQRKAAGNGGKTAPSLVSSVLSSGGGRPMDTSTRHFMESRFGQDFGQVRIHTGSQAAESAEAIRARAYTSGRNIVFGSGEYQPGNEEGKRLLAHELVHVGQQQGGGVGRMISRACKYFPAGWRKGANAGNWCEKIEEARADAARVGCPSGCFIYRDGPATHKYRKIPGFSCAHYVAHRLQIPGPKGARCLKGFAVQISVIIRNKAQYNWKKARVGDIWVEYGGRHSGYVSDVLTNPRRRVFVKQCNTSGEVRPIEIGSNATDSFYR